MLHWEDPRNCPPEQFQNRSASDPRVVGIHCCRNIYEYTQWSKGVLKRKIRWEIESEIKSIDKTFVLFGVPVPPLTRIRRFVFVQSHKQLDKDAKPNHKRSNPQAPHLQDALSCSMSHRAENSSSGLLCATLCST